MGLYDPQITEKHSSKVFPADRGPRDRKQVDMEDNRHPVDIPADEAQLFQHAGGKYERIISQFIDRMYHSYNHWNEIWGMSDADIKFAYGDQWPAGAESKRDSEDRPTLSR